MEGHMFWYIWASDGRNGFLLDLICRPRSAAARLALFSDDRPARVTRETGAAEDLSRDDATIRFGSVALGPSSCRGAVGGVDFDVAFRPSGRSMDFVPSRLHRALSRMSGMVSRYAVVEEGRCGAVRYANVPLVYSTYGLHAIAACKWIIISAPRFEGSDLALEICATCRWGVWGAAAYVRYLGKEHKINGLWTCLTGLRVREAGGIREGRRVFAASIRTAAITMDVEAWAPAADFAELEREGRTTIHTTLFGDCEVAISPADGGSRTVFRASRTCLLEVKQRSPRAVGRD
jgi:hypothetical protein